MKLARTLQTIYEFELSCGNQVERIDEPAGSICPYAVVFMQPLHIDEIEKQLSLDESVFFWESFDPHYSIERGYQCKTSKHCVCGPIVAQPVNWVPKT